METVSALRLEQAINKYKGYYREYILSSCSRIDRYECLYDNLAFGEWLDDSKNEEGFVSDLIVRGDIEDQLSITYDDLTEDEQCDWDTLVEMYKDERFIDELAWEMHNAGLGVNQVPVSYSAVLEQIYNDELEEARTMDQAARLLNKAPDLIESAAIQAAAARNGWEEQEDGSYRDGDYVLDTHNEDGWSCQYCPHEEEEE